MTTIFFTVIPGKRTESPMTGRYTTIVSLSNRVEEPWSSHLQEMKISVSFHFSLVMQPFKRFFLFVYLYRGSMLSTTFPEKFSAKVKKLARLEVLRKKIH